MAGEFLGIYWSVTGFRLIWLPSLLAGITGFRTLMFVSYMVQVVILAIKYYINMLLYCVLNVVGMRTCRITKLSYLSDK